LFNSSEIIFKKDAEKKKSFIKNLNNLNPFSNKKNNNENNDTLFIHIHGGAYIAGSTFDQENYLREWCKKFGIPFLGIDYGLSPAHK
jgi:acetyl esterase/lipase